MTGRGQVLDVAGELVPITLTSIFGEAIKDV